MFFFRAFTQLAGSLTEANRFERLMSLSDAELSRRGFDRSRLVRSYIDGIGAQ